MKKVTIVLVFLAAAGVVSAQITAQFTEVNGKVEVRPAGSSGWTAAAPGMAVDAATMIATGFNASAALRMGDSVVRVQQLTRMEFEGILEQEDAVETRLNLNVGRMSAQVRSTDGRAQNFQVRSPISTAAVRGTDFEYDGEQVVVTQGEVLIANQLAHPQPVKEGQQSTTSATEPPSTPAREALEQAVTNPGPIGSGSSEEREFPPPPAVAVDTPAARPTRGSITVEIR